MRVIFDNKRNIWKIELEDKKHSLSTNEFLVLTGLRDRNDRKFHHMSELIFTSKISEIGEMVVDMIRKNQFEVMPKRNIFNLDSLKKMLSFRAE